MSATSRQATRDYSRMHARLPAGFVGPSALRAALAATALVGALLLVVATFSTIIQITVGTTSRLANLDTELSGADRHGPALVLLAAFAVAMTAGALRGARPAMAALVVCGIAGLLISLVGDLPHLNDTGQVGVLYSDARAAPRVGYYAETLGGILLVIAGGVMLLASTGTVREAPERRRDAESHPLEDRPAST
ncbi:MAG: hypothetical protein JWO74_2642 [Solirubrobacterales bacterium]|nr:hypothetical protein [Solirubrobacterales bacterium]